MKSFFIRTFGCQMNEYDSQCIEGQLIESGFERAENTDEADIILFNTCSVREHAVQRLYKVLEDTRKLKENKPGMVIGVCGCLAEQEQAKLFDKFPWVQVIIGPGSISAAGKAVIRAAENRSRIVKTGNFESLKCGRPARNGPGIAYVPIIRGCNNFCSYCVVPFLRGREQSRAVEEILEEIRQAAKDGYSEIMLLGQNVCSFKDSSKFPPQRRVAEGATKVKSNDFAELLKELEKIEGVRKIRFMTAHPKDITEELIRTIASSDKVVKEFHLPLQSGSDRVLKAMNRGYTRNDYLRLVRNIAKEAPCAVLSTDVIVGFPGETEEDFLETLQVLKEARFNNAFMFKYSDRPGTKASGMPGKIPEKTKEERLKRLIALNAGIIREKRSNHGRF